MNSRHPLFGAYERVARAANHRERLASLQEEAAEDFERLVDEGEYDPEDPTIEPWPVPLDLAIALGEAVYNLRSALDYLAYELAENSPDAATTPARRRQFPISDTRAKFKNDVRSAGLRAYCRRLQETQPFPDQPQNRWLLNLQLISNYDKHRMLQPHFAAPRTYDFAIVRSLRDDTGALLLDKAPIVPVVEEMANGVLGILRTFEEDFESDRTPWYMVRP